VPFRKAHELVGKAVAVSVGTGTPLNQLSLQEFQEISPEYGEDVHNVFNLDRAFELRTTPGAPNPANTARRITYWQEKLA
jgi:argininosuccinate lyase